MSLSKMPILLALLGSSAFASTPAKVDQNIDHIFSKWNESTPGCAVGVGKGGHLEYSRAYGLADLEHRIPNSVDTVFEAGSVSKQFTAMAILMLGQEGKLSLDDPARKYIPELPDYGVPVTIRALLTHTSGLRDWGEIATIEGWPRTTRVYDDADVLNIIGRQRELNFTPGTRWSYNNTGYNLAEMIVSRVSGMSLAEFTRQRIFVPLGMSHTSWRDDYTRIVPDRAIAYSRHGDAFHADMAFENTYGHGGLLTTVGDLLKWNEHLDSPGPVESGLVEMQQQNYRLDNGRPTNYGYGLFIHRYKELSEIGHTGSTAGYTAFLARYPGMGLSIAMLCNVAEVNSWEYGHAIADVWIPNQAKREPAMGKGIRLSSAQMSHILGTYRDVQTGRPTKISSDSGNVMFGADMVMIPTSPGRFLLDGKKARLDAHGTLTITDGYGPVDQLERVAPANPSALPPARLVGRYASPELAGDVMVSVSGASVILTLGTKTVWTLEPAYDNVFSNQEATAIFAEVGSGGSRLTISTDRIWRLELSRVR